MNRTLSIMIVDDNLQNLLLLEEVFRDLGHSVISAHNGREALDMALSRPPDIVISDILMPEMDGFELCRHWKSDKVLTAIPFIFYTATYGDPQDERYALSLGADRFIVKPQRPEVIIKAVLDMFTDRTTKTARSRKRAGGAGFPAQYNEVLSRKLEKKVKDLEEEIQTRRRVEDNLVLRNAILVAQLETTTDAVLAVDDKARVLFLNKRFVELWGIPFRTIPDDPAGPAFDFISNRILDPDNILPRMKFPCIKSEKPVSEEMALSDGRYLEIFSSPIKGKDGRCFGRVFYFRDVTERKKYEKRLALQADLLDAAIDSIFLFDADGKVIYANRNAAELRGYTVEEMTALTLNDLVPPENRAIARERAQFIFRDGFALYESVHVKKSGAPMNVEVLARVLNVDGTPHILASTRDISVRKRTLQSLSESEERFRTLFEVSPEIMCTITLEGDFITCNPAFETVTGWPRDEWSGQPLAGILHPDDLVPVFCQAVNITFGGPALRAEGRMRTSSGEYLLFDFSFAPYSSEGEMVGMHMIARDITERKRAEVALRESEEKFRSIFSHAAEGILLVEMENMRFALSNPACLEMTGYTADELTRLGVSELYPAESMPAVRESMASFLRGETDFHNAVQVKRKDGGVFDAEMSVAPAEIGGKRYYILMFTDVTARKQAERQLAVYRNNLEKLVTDRTAKLSQANAKLNAEVEARRETEDRLNRERTLLRTLIDSLPDQIYAKNRRGRYTLANINLLRSLGLAEFRSILGRSDFDFFPGVKAEQLHREEQKIFKEERPLLESEEEITSQDGEHRWFLISKVPFRDDSGTMTGLVGINRDITRLKRTEEGLEQAKELAEAANAAKSSFLAGISHEIRTPMNAILGFSRLMLNDPELTPQQRERLAVINRSGEHLINLLNDVVEISKIETGHATVTTRGFDARALVRELATLFRTDIEKKRLSFSVSFADDLPASLISDDMKIRQILINLLSNAVKFTAHGGIEVRVGAERQTDGEEFLTVEVIDTGRGIPPAELRLLFQEFIQGAGGRESGGSGLGLSLSRRLARLLDGDLTAESAVGSGSRFLLRLPVRFTEATLPPPDPDRHGSARLKPGPREYAALIVDDNRDNREYLSTLLRSAGFAVLEAADGPEAIAAFKARPPDAILMDVNMPGMDGFETAGRIRKMEGGAAVPIIAVTANAYTGDRGGGGDTAFNLVIVKPFREAELFEALGRFTDVQFEYITEKTGAPEGLRTMIDQLGNLPGDLVRLMIETVRTLEIRRLLEAIDRAERGAPDAAAYLRRLAKNYQYDQLSNILKEAYHGE